MNRTKIIDLIAYREQLEAQQQTHNEDLISALENLIQRLKDCNPITAPTGKLAKSSF